MESGFKFHKPCQQDDELPYQRTIPQDEALINYCLTLNPKFKIVLASILGNINNNGEIQYIDDHSHSKKKRTVDKVLVVIDNVRVNLDESEPINMYDQSVWISPFISYTSSQCKNPFYVSKGVLLLTTFAKGSTIYE